MSNSNYKQSFKSFSILGSIQVLVMLINIARTKIVAVLLGASGVGMLGLFQTTIDLICAISNMGFGTSSVRNVSEANSGNKTKLYHVVYCVTRLSQYLGVVGFIICILLSEQLSIWTFNTPIYSLDFKILSIVCLLTSLNAGQLALLQGFRKIKSLAHANFFGAIFSLLLSAPLFYFLGVRGIIPSLLLLALNKYLVGLYFVRKNKIIGKKTEKDERKKIFSSIMKVGIMMTLSGSIMTTLFSYILKAYIGNIGGLEEVGYYQAFFSIVNGYVGVIFTAMATDFYPRLSASNNDNMGMTLLVNEQISLSLLILCPVLFVLLLFSYFFVPLLYSSAFLALLPLLQWSLIGVLFKAISFCISYIFVALGNAKIFMYSETISNLLMLGLNIVGYKLGGLRGLGICFTLGFVAYTFIAYLFANRTIGFKLFKDSLNDYIMPVIIFIIGTIVYMLITDNLLLGVGFLVIIIYLDYCKLNKRLQITEFLKLKFRKK